MAFEHMHGFERVNEIYESCIKNNNEMTQRAQASKFLKLSQANTLLVVTHDMYQAPVLVGKQKRVLKL